jgi:hypothetical protein
LVDDIVYPTDSPEYGLGGAAYANARALKEKEQTTQAWHDQNAPAPSREDWAIQRLRWIVDCAPLRRNKWVEDARIPWRLIEETREALRIYDEGAARREPAKGPD